VKEYACGKEEKAGSANTKTGAFFILKKIKFVDGWTFAI
jgi:hypothetical protein